MDGFARRLSFDIDARDVSNWPIEREIWAQMTVYKRTLNVKLLLDYFICKYRDYPKLKVRKHCQEYFGHEITMRDAKLPYSE